MPAVDAQRRLLHGHEVDRRLLARDRRRRPQGHAHDERHAVGDAAVDAAGVVGRHGDAPVLQADGVVCLTAAHFGKGEAAAELHALHAGNGIEHAGDAALHAAEEQPADAGGHARDDALKLAADGVAGAARIEDGALHVEVELLARRLTDAHGVGRDRDAAALEDLAADRPGEHEARREPAAERAAAAQVGVAAEAHGRGIVRVARARDLRVIGRAVLVLVAEDGRDGRAGRHAVEDAAHHERVIGLGAVGRQVGRAGGTPAHLDAHGVHVDGLSGRDPVEHDADRRAVRLAENRHFYTFAIGVHAVASLFVQKWVYS